VTILTNDKTTKTIKIDQKTTKDEITKMASKQQNDKNEKLKTDAKSKRK